jgi:tRNA(adenine34) deaminase
MAFSLFSDEYYMNEALKEAQKAYEADEVPVGAVVVCNKTIIARGHNLTERLNDVTAHAEMQAITAAAAHMGAKYLIDCTLYVTLEPCVMCAGANFWAQMSRIVYGASDAKRGFLMKGADLIHPKTTLSGGVLAAESEKLLKEFFKSKR